MVQKIPPEFADYYSFMRKMQKKGAYSDYAIKRHISNAKRIGYLLMNSDGMEPREIARMMCSGSKASEDNLAWTLNDYRMFINRGEKMQRQNEILMTLQDKVLV